MSESSLLKGLINEIRNSKKRKNVDFFELIEKRMITLREDLLRKSRTHIKKMDPEYNEDPNPIFNKKFYAKSILKHNENKKNISMEDLTCRILGAFTKGELKEIRKKEIVFSGMGSCNQVSITAFAKLGLKHFVLIDDDKFESKNAWQLMCSEEDLNKPKVVAIKKGIKSINHAAIVKTYQIKINEENVDSLIKNANFVFDGLDNKEARVIVSRSTKNYNIPWFHSAVAGDEGIYMLFMPKNPSYESIWNYSTPHYNVGINPLVSFIIGTLKVNDAIKLTLKRDDVLRYPNFISINMRRTNPVVIRNVRNLFPQ